MAEHGRSNSDMSYTVHALSIDGDVEAFHISPQAALDFAMQLGSRGCRAISIQAAGGEAYNLTTFFRLQSEPNDPRLQPNR
jgi:hypothetical protein